MFRLTEAHRETEISEEVWHADDFNDVCASKELNKGRQEDQTAPQIINGSAAAILTTLDGDFLLF